jgi:hypothetical protein
MDNPETQATMSTQDTGRLEAARIVTGLLTFTKTEILYRDRLGIIICETEEKETSTFL